MLWEAPYAPGETNTFGALGNNTPTNSMSSVPVSGLTGATAVGGGNGWAWALVNAA